MTMQNGRVSIVAKDATLRQIMTEWARVGQTKIVNVERIPGGPMTIELNNVPEEQALAMLMRPLSGYLAAPRAVDAPNASRYDRILVMPTVAAARPAATASSAPPPVFQSSPGLGQPTPVEPDEPDERAATPAIPSRPPVFTTFPQPQVANPAAVPPNGYTPPPGMQLPTQPPAAPQPTAVPTVPAGVSVPGMMVPVPQPPPGTPGAPPVRRPGGGE